MNGSRYCLVVAIITLLSFTLLGCNRADVPSKTTEERAGYDVTSIPVVIDPATGCQYVGFIGHGVTPRMSKKGGNWHHVGCDGR